MRKLYDRFWKEISALVFFIYFGLAYFDLVDKWVPTILIIDGVLAGISVIYLFIYFYINRKPRLDIASALTIIFVLSMIISSIVGKTNVTRLAVMAFQIVQIFTVTVALYSLVDDLEPILWFSGLFAVLFISYGAWLSLRNFDTSNEYLRLEFLGTGTNSAGANFGIAILMALMMLRKRNGIILNTILIALVPFLFYVQTLTQSRTAQLATVVGFVIWAFAILLKGKRINIKTIVICLIILALGLVVLLAFLSSDRVKNIDFTDLNHLTSNRVSIWEESIASMGKKEFFFGYGGNTERMVAQMEASGASWHTVDFASWHFLHNLYLQIYVDYGIFALISFTLLTLYLLLKGLIELLRAKKDTERSRLLPPAIALAAFLTAQNMMESLALYIGGAEQMIFVTSLALLYILTKKNSKATS